MKRMALAVGAAVVAAACSTTGGSGKLRPAAAPNEAARTNLGLAVEYMQRREYAKALEKLDRARDADPDYPLTYNTYGVLYQALGDNARAEQNFRHALRLAGEDSPTLNNYGRFLCQQRRVDEALRVFERAAANPLYTTPEIPLTNAGVCVAGTDRNAGAKDYFRRALESNPRMAPALLQMSHIAHDDGEFLKARGYLQRYLEVASHTPDSLWLGIQIEEKLGDKDAVASYSLQLRNNFPDSVQAQKLRNPGTK
jgi:type IV pilus assembly protein PilF